MVNSKPAASSAMTHGSPLVGQGSLGACRGDGGGAAALWVPRAASWLPGGLQRGIWKAAGGQSPGAWGRACVSPVPRAGQCGVLPAQGWEGSALWPCLTSPRRKPRASFPHPFALSRGEGASEMHVSTCSLLRMLRIDKHSPQRCAYRGDKPDAVPVLSELPL